MLSARRWTIRICLQDVKYYSRHLFFFSFKSKWEKVIQIRKGCSGLKPYGDHRPCTTRCTDQLSAGFQENNAVRTDFWNCPETPHQHSVIRAWKMWKRGLGGKMKWKYGVIAPAVWKGRQWKGFKSLLRRFERTSQFTSFKTDGQSKKKKKNRWTDYCQSCSYISQVDLAWEGNFFAPLELNPYKTILVCLFTCASCLFCYQNSADAFTRFYFSFFFVLKQVSRSLWNDVSEV